MLFKNVLVPLFAVSVTAATLKSRDIVTVQSDITTLISDQDKSDKNAKAFDGSFGSSYTVTAATTGIQNDIYKFGNDSQAMAKPDSTQCAWVQNLVSNNLETSVKNYVNDIVAKKAQYNALGWQLFWKQTFQQYQKSYNNALTAFCVKCTTNACAYAIEANYDDIQVGINAFS